MPSRRPWLAALAAAAFAACAAPRAGAEERAPDAIVFDVPVRLNGRYAGDVTASVDMAGNARASPAALAEALSEELSPETLAHLRNGPDAGAERDLAQAQLGPLSVAYDPSEVAIAVTAPTRVFATREINLAPAAPAEETPLPPARFAAGGTISLSQRYVHDGADAGRAPLSASVTLRANAGGREGLYLVSDFQFSEAAREPWTQGPTLAFADNTETAVRISAGEMAPLAAGHQQAPQLLGVAVQRLYSRLQPQRNYRASGRNSFTLDRDSTVAVQVNGQTVRTLRLEAGVYDLRSLPFVDGMNDVAIVVDDDQGRRELARQTLFFDNTLLGQGVVDFAAHAGALRTSVADGYASDLAFSGYVRYGALNNLTLGLNGQADSDIAMAGAEASWAAPIGTVFFEAAASEQDDYGAGTALSLGWSLRRSGGEDQSTIEVAADFTSRDFAVLGTARPDNQIASSLSVRYERQLGEDATLRAGFSSLARRGPAPNERRASIAYGRKFGALSLMAAWEVRDAATGPRHDVSARLSWRLGPRRVARARHRTGLRDTSLEYQWLPTAKLGDAHGRIQAVDSTAGSRLLGEVDFEANRFRARAAHESTLAVRGPAAPEHASRLDLSIGFGFADGRAAFGRPAAAGGFAIVDRNEALAAYPINLLSGESEHSPVRARTDRFGPLLVPLSAAYRSERLGVDASAVPDELRPAVAAFALAPGEFSGYALVLRPDETLTAIARLISQDGGAVGLAVGRLIDADGTAVEVFTNRNGRMYAAGLRPGSYRLELTTGQVGEIDLPSSADRILTLGDVIVHWP